MAIARLSRARVGDRTVRQALAAQLVSADVLDETETTNAPVAAADSQVPLRQWIGWVAGTLVVTALVYLIAEAWLLPDCGGASGRCSAQSFHVRSGYSAFAGLFVLALAVERLLEPFSRWIGPDTDKAASARDQKSAHAENRRTDEAVQELAAAQAALDQKRQIATITHWGVAVSVSYLLVAPLNTLLLTAIASPRGDLPPRWLDLLVTGLAVGAGTKPLHDLVSRIQSSKDAKKDPPATGGTA